MHPERRRQYFRCEPEQAPTPTWAVAVDLSARATTSKCIAEIENASCGSTFTRPASCEAIDCAK